MTRSVRPWCLKRRTSLIRRIDNLWVGIRLPHWLNEKSVARLSCRPKRPAPPKRAHDRLKSVLTIPRNAHVKYLRRIKLVAEPAMGFWETKTYTQLLPNGEAYQFYF